ncbi:MAG: hypothetical protein WC314_17010 [Vulcanimicrobiota bacterium]
MSINNIQANQVKKSVMKVAGRFQKLDETPADTAKGTKDSVFVRGDSQVELPNSTGNQLARLAVGALAPKEEDLKATGSTSAKDGKLESAHVVTTAADGQESVYQFRKLEDGSQVFHGPTEGGYAVVKENKDGTLTMVTSEGPNEEAYWKASQWENNGETAPQTLGESLQNLAPKPEKSPGFLAPFGQTPKAESEKGPAEEVVEKVTEKSKSVAQSVKDWSQSDTGQSIGDLLFGIANPWKKKG